jgi:transcriptional regulator with GAF, ATPase, and Fis domain
MITGRAARTSPPSALLPESHVALARVFERAVSALAQAVRFDIAELQVLGADGRVRVVSCAPNAAATTSEGSRSDFSERLWPTADAAPRHIDDTAADLDPAFDADRRHLDGGSRSMWVAALRSDQGELGSLALVRTQSSAFDPAHAALVASAAELLSVAIEREHQWSREQTRHRRRVRLEAALPTLATSLDVRQVFARLSGLIQEVIPHDVLAFALLLPDRSGVRVQAATDKGVLELPEYRFSNPEEALDSNWQFLLAYDLTPVDAQSVRARISPHDAAQIAEVVTRPGAEWMKFISQAQVRSILRVPIRSNDRPIGGVVLMSRARDAYDGEDGLVASRIADQLALALAHQELAEEARRMALAEERARQLELRVDLLSRELERFSAHRAIGQSAAWKRALADATQVAPTDATVLVTGESGTGKEVIARYIHRASKRAKGPFVALNCAALPEQLMESELFGHERGAFTGATEARAGRIEQAAGGVLFLDEVGEMSPAVQAKFLRVLQEREFQRVGGARVLKADVRIIAATNRDPRASIAAGEFREDLYYRLSVFEIHLPPLRERPEDILLLSEAFLEEVGRSIGRPAAGLSESAREQLLVHSWPGNVRELRNAIERAVILCHGGLVSREHLPMSVARPHEERVTAAASRTAEFPVEGVPLSAVERELLVGALAKARNNKSEAARLLGLSRGQLYSLLRRHGLTDARR